MLVQTHVLNNPSTKPEVRGTADGGWRSLSAIPSAASYALTTYHHLGSSDGRTDGWTETDRGVIEADAAGAPS